MSGSSNLNSFRDRRQVGRIVGVLWDVVARTYSRLLAAFLCNCRLASSPAVLLESMSCIHTAVSMRPLPGRNCNQTGDISTLDTSRQIHLPKKQRLINRKGQRHEVNEGMDSYQ